MQTSGLEHALKNHQMNKNTLYNNIKPCGWPMMPVLTVRFFFYKEFLPKASTIDYIELKTKLGGLTMIKSITQNSFIKSFFKFMHCLLSNIRPREIFNKAANLNRTLILERQA